MKTGLLSEFDGALREAFSYPQLKRLVDNMPGRKFDELTPVMGATMKEVVFDLLGNVQRQGWLFELARQAYEENPGNAKLALFWTEHQRKLKESVRIEY